MALSMSSVSRSRQIAELAVGVDDRSLVRSDGMGAVFERGADVIHGRLAVVDVEGCRFEQNVGFRGRKPVADIVRARPRFCGMDGRIRPMQRRRLPAIRLRNPSPAPRSDSRDAK